MAIGGNNISITGKSFRVNEFRTILRQYEEEKENLGIGTISGKRKIVRSAIRMAGEPDKPEGGNTIRQVLWAALHHEQRDTEILQTLQDIEDWCKYRNEIIHCLLNKNLDSLNEQIEAKAKEGFQLFRRLDNQVQWVRRKKLREKVGLKS